jgi:hypothetical protein
MLAAALPSRPIPVRLPFLIASTRLFPVGAAGAAGKLSEPTVSKPNWPNCVPLPNGRKRALSRQLIEILELVRQYGPEPVADAITKASAAHASPPARP